MIDDDQLVFIKLCAQNRNWYKSMGYDISNSEIYVHPKHITYNSKKKFKCVCDYCNKTFEVKCADYRRHHTDETWGEYKCKDCYHKNINSYSLISRQNYIYNKVLESCNRNKYILLTDKENIKTVNSEISYICPKHGKQLRRANLFIYGNHICPLCNIDLKCLTPDEVEQRIKSRGSILYNKSDYVGTTIPNLKVMCVKCGNTFITSYNSFYYTRSGNSQYCRECSKCQSSGEIKIMEYLDSHNIEYVYQKTFNDCKDINVLPFDFYINAYNTIVEFDGEQHFTPVDFGGGDADKAFKYVKSHDEIKNNYCKNNNINIVRIPYYEYSNIENILSSILNIT